jgi:transcriptional regulator with XRE-family HTH domain
VDFEKLAAELVRTRRGARTQRQLSRLLGYQSNVVFAWENTRDIPSARAFFRLAQVAGTPADPSEFLGHECPDLTERAGIAAFMKQLLGSFKMAHIGHQLGRDRHAVGRWLRGQTDVSLPELLHFIEVTTLRIYDFLAVYVDPAELSEAAPGYALLEAARESARQMPWSHAIVHMAELPSYQALKAHERGWFASRLGISIQDEDACLALLVKMGQLSYDGCAYRGTQSINVDTRQDPIATRQLASFWMREGAQRVLTPGRGRFAFNTFAVSKKDVAKAKELQSEYFQKLRTLVAESEPAEAVAVATFQFFPLFEEPTDEQSEAAPDEKDK